MKILETKQLKKYYGSGDTLVKALDGINLSVEQGEFVSIVGTSGSGKSTLLHMLGGLDRPTSGVVRVEGRDISKLKDEELTIFRRRKIGFVFQSYNLVPVLNVYENIVLPIELDGNQMDTAYVKDIIEVLGLEKKKYNLPSQLSGGQQQRVALARTLAQNPQIILADEPVASLDPVTAKQVMEDFQRINREMNITILLNIHHVELALTYASRVVGIRAGQIVYDGPVSDVNEEILNNIYEGKLEQEVAG